jgi:hypothetical protein
MIFFRDFNKDILIVIINQRMSRDYSVAKFHPSDHSPINLSYHLCVSLSSNLSIKLFASESVSMSTHLSVQQLIHPIIHLSLHLSTHPACLLACLHVYSLPHAFCSNFWFIHSLISSSDTNS